MSDHFTLDVDPDTLRDAVRTLRHLAESTDHKGDAVARTPGEIGDQWTGQAATSIKSEMTGLGAHMKRFSPKFTAAKDAVRSLADDYDEALKEVEKLNERYRQADRDYQAAVNAAHTQYDDTVASARPDDGRPLNRAIQQEIADVRDRAVSTAYGTRQDTRHNLEVSFGMTKQWVAQQTRACAAKLAEAAPLPVPPDAVAEYRAKGLFPVRLDRSSLEAGMRLTAQLDAAEIQREQEQEGREAAQALKGADGEVTVEMAQQIRDNMTNAYFAHGFASELSPEEVAWILGEYHDEDGVSPSSATAFEPVDPVYALLVESIGTTIATATCGRGDLALPDGYAAQYAAAITADVSEDVPPNQAQYLALLMEYGTWDTAFLDTVGDTLYDYERSKDGDPVWGPKANMAFPVRGPDNKVRLDVMASLMKALEHNPEAAQEFFADGGTATIDVDGRDLEVSERMKYLVSERTWDTMTDPTNGANLGGALEAATTTVRDQTEKGRTSAELAGQLFAIIGDKTGEGSDDPGPFNDDGWQMWDGMRDSVADIVTDYSTDLMRMGRNLDADPLGPPWTVGPEERYFGDGVPYGAAMDPALMQKVLGTLAEDQKLIERIVAGVGAVSQTRMSFALRESLLDGSEPAAPVAMLQGLNLPQVSTATNEAAATLGWLLNGAYRGVLEDEALAKKQAEMRKQLFDAVSSIPGIGPAGKWSEFAFDQAKGYISDQLGKSEGTGSSTYGDLSREEEDSLRKAILNRMLVEGYFDEQYIVEANGSPDGTRYAAPPPGAITPGDPPTFDFDSPDYQDWLRTKFPLDEYLNSNVFVPFNKSMNDGLDLAGAS